MKMKIPGNRNYYIKEVGDEFVILDKNNIRVTLAKCPKNKNKYSFSLYNMLVCVELEWLYWLSYYKILLPKEYQEHVTKIVFHKHGLHKKVTQYPRMVTFSEPVPIVGNAKYRLIARYPSYGINEDGELLVVRTNKIRKPKSYGEDMYLTTYLVDQAISAEIKTHRTLTHRLVGLTWVPNDDFVKKPIVDHIDGNKTNCNANNLRWISYSGNNKAAVNTGLRDDNLFVKVRNIDTGKINKFSSLTDAVKFIGRSRINTKHTDIKYGKLWSGANGKYEIMLSSDNRPWFFTKNIIADNTNAASHVITITKENGKLITYYGVMKFISSELSLDGRLSLKDAVSRYKLLNPNDLISVKTAKKSGVIAARDISTGTVFTAKSESELSKKISLPKSTINKYRGRGSEYLINGFQICDSYSEEYVWPIPKDQRVNTPKRIKVTDTNTGISKIYNSLREVSRVLNMSRASVTAHIRYKRRYADKYNIEFVL